MLDALKPYFPELSWTLFTPDELQLVLHNLDGYGTDGPPAAQYLRAHATRFGYFPQAASGAGWTLRGNISVPPGTDLNNQRILAALIHEVLHLQQTLTTRLSIQGELLGWQLEYRAYHTATGNYYGQPGQPFAGTAAQWQQISGLSPQSYPDLAQAQDLMVQVAPTYRAKMLPLFPLGRQVSYTIMQGFQRNV